VLAPGLQLGIETMAVLFTDLIGSTAMYAKTGDAGAFRIVNDHFDVVRDIVGRHEGAMVKTIGDAVMAVFVDPAKCFDAALELDESIRTISADGEPLRMRVGFHVGPCIAMRANDRIDYFGTTVNLAARLESLTLAGEITLAKEVAERPAIASRLAALGTRVSEETVHVKGITEDVAVVRVSS
jgi:class 3 adenylate cyclase